jgi:dihydrofolate synthase/folylpolyglutamate synthase
VTPFEFLYSLERLGMKFGLENITTLCAELGNPERAFASVIIGGTNGKGSVAAWVSTALDRAGIRCGRYTSPHLERLEERFVIAGREIETGELERTIAVVQDAVERLVRSGLLTGPPTFFECATAAAFELFRRTDVTCAVLEVGLGGRLDATNVVSPVAAAITSIDFDHQAQLGPTLESIAREKAGIIKPRIAVICGPMPAAAEEVIAAICAEREARFIRAADTASWTSKVIDGRTVVDMRTAAHALTNLTLSLRGRHQVANAAVALCLLEAMADRGFDIPEQAIRASFEGAQWPARLEQRSFKGADVLLDAAHNPAGARALAAYLREIGWTGVTLVFGALRDKDANAMLGPLLPLCSRVICTTPSTPRALDAQDLLAVARTLPGAPADVELVGDPETALRAACAAGARVVVAGSIFLVGPLRGILR